MYPSVRRRPLLLVAGACALLLGLAIASTATLANQTIRYQITADADDAEEILATGEVVLTSSDLEITEDGGDNQLVGLRFTDIDLPQGLPILGAYIQFTTDEDDKSTPNFDVLIEGEAAGHAAAFTEALQDISLRPRTAEQVAWSGIPAWTVEHEASEDQRTPDIKDIVQEIIDQPDWQAGNAMAFILTGTGTRSAESHDGSMAHVEVSDLAPKLVLRVPSTETYRVAASDDDAEEGDDGAGILDIDSSDLELVEDHENEPDRRQTIGIRLTDVAIPTGARILSAHLQFAVDEGDKNSDPFDVTIWGEAADNPAAYADTAYNISSRDKTNASVSWSDIPFWAEDDEGQPGGPDQRTPDLTAVVQEIVDRAGWKEGNAMAFIIQGEGQRTAESFDGDSALAPALVVTFIGEQTTPSAYRVRLTWGAGDDPTTQMNLIWDQVRGSGPVVHYDFYDPLQGCPTDLAQYAFTQAPQRSVNYRGMNNHIATLNGLAAGTDYRFVIADQTGATDCMWFRTAPATPRAVHLYHRRRHQVLRQRPDGRALVEPDGRQAAPAVRALYRRLQLRRRHQRCQLAAMVDGLVRANPRRRRAHDPDHRRARQPRGRRSGVHALQPVRLRQRRPLQPIDYSYGSLTFAGGLLHVINLNSQLYLNGLTAAHERQTDWLAEDLAAHQTDTFKIAGYHKPIRPHTSSKAENDHELAWADLFDTYGLTIANESDTHNHKFTFPLRRSDESGNDMGFVRDDDNGVLYVGEGSWGATPRADNDDKSWTLDSASINQIKWNHIYPAEGEEPARIDIHTVLTARYEDGQLVNYVEGVGSVDDADPFALPDKITLYEAPFYGAVISVPFQALSGEPPAAPTDLTGAATSYTDITISWANVEAPANVSGISVDRRIGSDGEWETIAGGLDSETSNFSQSELEDGTDYYYRVRANNVFGSSEWSNVVLVSTPVDTRLRIVLSEGANGYAGSQVIAIASASPDDSFAAQALSFDQATSDYGGPGVSQGLIRFDNALDALPAEHVVTGAELRFRITSASNGPWACTGC